MDKNFLAVDIGASSGRHILGTMEDGRLKLKEIYRFTNGMELADGHLCWNTEHLFSEILTGMKKCSEIGIIPDSMGIDTWGVDYVLLDRNDKVIGSAYGYRDTRTEGMERKVYECVPEKELYAATGIQKQPFNTVYQLMAQKLSGPEDLEKAEVLLMLPDYFHFLLTGSKKSEYTNATTTGLVNAESHDWDRSILRRLGYPEKLFLPLSTPGTVVGPLKAEIAAEVGYTCEVVMPATHDTASAVAAVPSLSDNTLYISSGTWSLMGVENPEPVLNETARNSNFTNEGGVAYRYRLLKNIMGLWMIQSVRRELGSQYSFADLCRLAEEEKDFTSRVDVNDDVFLAPAVMQEAVRSFCRRTGQEAPVTPGEMAAVIYQSLAGCYARTAGEIEALTGRHYDAIHIVGGGSNADYLNRLTAEKSGRTVYAGPGEATAVGNLIVQMMHAGIFRDLKDARKVIAHSFTIQEYQA